MSAFSKNFAGVKLQKVFGIPTTCLKLLPSVLGQSQNWGKNAILMAICIYSLDSGRQYGMQWRRYPSVSTLKICS